MYLNKKDKHIIGMISYIIGIILRKDISKKVKMLLLAACKEYLETNEFIV